MLMASGSSPAVTPAKAPVATRKPVQPAAAAIAAPAAAPKWKSANSEWLWNPRKGAAFELRAENKVAIWQGLAQPTIVVRCESNKMVAFVYTASAIQMEAQDSNHTVRLNFDDEPEATERWADSSDHDALFAPDGPAFVQRLTNARTLKFGYTPHNASRAVAEFQVSGLSETILPAAKQCGLKK
jgi:hypothetical protein